MQDRKMTRHQARVYQEILEAAGRAFARNGYSSTSVDEISREAEVATSTLYRYFSGKEAIYNGLIEQMAQQVTGVFDEPMMPSLSYEQRVELLVRRQLMLIENQRDFYLMLVKDGVLTQWRLASDDTISGAAFRQIRARLADVLREGMEAGALREIEPSLAATFIYGALTMIFFEWAKEGGVDSLQDRTPALLAVVFQGLQQRENGSSSYLSRFG